MSSYSVGRTVYPRIGLAAERIKDPWIDSARQYGRNDVRLGKAEERAAGEFRNRHPMTRALVLWGLDHPELAEKVPEIARRLVRIAHAGRLRPLSSQICGAVFNLAYWLGVADQLGSAKAALALAKSGSPPGLLSRARSGLPIGARSARQ